MIMDNKEICIECGEEIEEDPVLKCEDCGESVHEECKEDHELICSLEP